MERSEEGFERIPLPRLAAMTTVIRSIPSLCRHPRPLSSSDWFCVFFRLPYQVFGVKNQPDVSIA